MRTILIIGLLLFAFGWFGWLQFSSSDGDPTIRVDSEKVKQDTAVIIEKSKDAFNGAANEIDDNVNLESADE